MSDPAALGPLPAAVFGPALLMRRLRFRPRPPYLPHPISSLARFPEGTLSTRKEREVRRPLNQGPRH